MYTSNKINYAYKTKKYKYIFNLLSSSGFWEQSCNLESTFHSSSQGPTCCWCSHESSSAIFFEFPKTHQTNRTKKRKKHQNTKRDIDKQTYNLLSGRGHCGILAVEIRGRLRPITQCTELSRVCGYMRGVEWGIRVY